CAPTAPPAIAPANRTAPRAATAAIFIRIVSVDPSPHRSLDHRALERMGRPAHILRTPELPFCAQHCVYEASGPESNGIVSRKPGVGLCCRDRRPRRVVVERARVHGDRDDLCRTDGEREPLVQVHELAQRRNWMRTAACAFDLRVPRLVAEDEKMRRASVVQADGHAGIDGVQDRALPSTTSRSAAPAMKSDTTASTAIPQPAIAMPVWPVGTKIERSPRLRAS